MPPIIPNKDWIDRIKDALGAGAAPGRELVANSIITLDDNAMNALARRPAGETINMSYRVDIDGFEVGYQVSISVKDGGLLPLDWTYADVLTKLLAQYTAARLK